MSLPLHDVSLDVVCALCDDNLLHCHGTSLVNGDGSYVCSDDPDCTLSVDEHWFISMEDDEISPL